MCKELSKMLEAENRNKTALVVLSGGQDSVTCLGVALTTYKQVFAVGFSYNQKHSIELMCAEKICKGYDVPFVVFIIPALEIINDSALIRGGNVDVSGKHPSNKNLPASFVPNRNALFLTTAHAYAQKLGVDHVITGVCETDFSGYPDCRRTFIDKLEDTLNVGYETDIKFITPLTSLTKAETFKLAEDHDFIDVVINDTHTCYNGARQPEDKQEWGYGCGNCPACALRADGYEEFING